MPAIMHTNPSFTSSWFIAFITIHFQLIAKGGNMSNGPQAMTDPWDWVSPGDNRFANNGAHSHLHQAQSAQQHRPNVGPNENFPAPPINSSMPQVRCV